MWERTEMMMRDEILDLLLKTALKHKDDEEAYAALMEAIREIKKLGCHDCTWYREGYCTFHFPGEERHPYYFCKDYNKRNE